MADNYIMLNGKRIDLTDEQIKTLMAEEKKNPFERSDCGDYYYIDYCGGVCISTEEYTVGDNEFYAVANYCTDKAMMEQRALHETLNRLLWRYSEEHGGDGEWNGVDKHWMITRTDKNIMVNFSYRNKINGAVHFKNPEAALSAIEEIVKPFIEQHPEFVW